MGEKKKQEGAGRQALYRKYRSRSLDEIVGQEHVTKTLAGALKKQKISHAYLFTGPRGTGKTSIARILAHAINELPYDDSSAHLDIIEIDAASNRRIDDIRDLREKVHIAPLSAKYKVYIIDEVHMLTNESFNALLKTLEEPPAHVIFMLATTEVHKLPATILSRVQRHALQLIAKDEVIKHLKYIADEEKISIDEEALALIAEHGGGSLRDSESLLDQMSAVGEHINVASVQTMLGIAPSELIASLLHAAQAGNAKETLELLHQVLSSGLTPSVAASQLMSLLKTQILETGADTLSVSLLSNLLEVHSAEYPELKLEVTLLSAVPLQQPATTRTVNENQEIVKKPAPKPEKLESASDGSLKPKAAQNSIQTEPAKQAQPGAIKKESEQAASPGNSTPNQILSQWQEILMKTKEKNNPLYTVLRLATPEIADDGLLLIFSFPFHQKKLEEPRHKALITEIIEEITGVTVAVSSVADKSRVKTPEEIAALADPARASLISSVQDIMGGGEVVKV